MHCGDQRNLGLCLGYVPALAYNSCLVSDQGTTLRASDLHNVRATILNPFNNAFGRCMFYTRLCMWCTFWEQNVYTRIKLVYSFWERLQISHISVTGTIVNCSTWCSFKCLQPRGKHLCMSRIFQRLAIRQSIIFILIKIIHCLIVIPCLWYCGWCLH